MSNAMRTGKRWLAGVAAGALGAALVPIGVVAVAAPAQASTYAVTAQFPSMTIVQTADDSIQIGLETSLNGEDTSIANTNVAVTITNSAGVNFLNTPASTDDTRFNVDDSLLSSTDLVNGVGRIILMTGANNTAGNGNFANIPAGTYTLGFTWVAANGVGIASTTVPLTIVSAANAGTIAGTGRYLTTGSWATASTLTSTSVATDDSINSSTGTNPQTRYVAFLNSTGGPIVAPADFFNAVAGPNQSGTTTALTDALTGNGSQPGIITLTSSATGAAGTWASSTGAGSYVTTFAAPVNQITATLPVTIAAAATIFNPAVTSAVSGALSPVNGSTVQITAPATNGVKFTVSGVTRVGGVATAGVPVTFTVAGRNTGNTANLTAYSSISPSSTTVVTSGPGGAFSLEYTVSNPVSTAGALVSFSVAGSAASTAFVRFATPSINAITALPATITTANTGTVDVFAYPVDQFGEPIANWPVQVSVSGVAATATPAVVTSNAAGEAKYTITIPAGTASGAASSVVWTAWNNNTFGTYTASTTVNYTSQSAAVANLVTTGSFNGNATLYTTLTGGALNSASNPMYVNTQNTAGAAYSPAYDGFAWKIQSVATNSAGAPIAGAPVTITGANGGKVLNSSGRWVDSVTVFSSSTGIVTAVLTSEKTGEISWSLSSGTASSTVKATYRNRPTDARYIDIATSSTEVAAGGGATITATVTDRYGNPVPGVPVTFGETGPGYIAGSGTATTGALGKAEATYVTVSGQEGKAVIDVTAGNGSTASVVMPSALPSASAQVPAAATTLALQVANAATVVTSYAIPTGSVVTASITGVTAGVATKALEVTVKNSASKSIAIVGERTTVSGKSGILVNGTVIGVEDGKTVTPFIRFPGETTFTAGTARPVIEGGDVSWQRKTGKRVTVYLELTDDALVKSNRVTIQAG